MGYTIDYGMELRDDDNVMDLTNETHNRTNR